MTGFTSLEKGLPLWKMATSPQQVNLWSTDIHRGKTKFQIPSLLIPDPSMLEVLKGVARSLCVDLSGNEVYNPPQVLAI